MKRIRDEYGVWYVNNNGTITLRESDGKILYRAGKDEWDVVSIQPGVIIEIGEWENGIWHNFETAGL